MCFRSTCQTPKSREVALNVQSGVGSNAPIERPAAGGDRVKVRVTHGEGTIFAACLPTERLVGGGCNGGEQCDAEQSCNWMRSYPGNFSDDDTVGARWVCSGARGVMYAFALCEATAEKPVVPAEPVVPADAGS